MKRLTVRRVFAGVWLSLSLLASGAPLAAAAAEASGDMVDFTFEAVDVSTFVRLVGEMTGRRFVWGDEMEGTVTVISPRVSTEEMYPLFLSILSAAGYTVRAEGRVHRVVPLETRGPVLAPILGPGEAVPASGFFTKVFRLEHVSAAEVQRLLGGNAGDEVAIRAMDETNHLLVTDTVDGIRRIADLLDELDQAGLARITDIIALQYAQADEMARQLNQALAESMTRAKELVGRLPGGRSSEREKWRTAHVVAVPHANRLIVTGTEAQVATLRDLVKSMDVDVPSGQGRLHAIFLRHLSAEEAAESISGLLARRQEQKDAERRGGSLISLEPNVSNNALLVDASPGDFEVVRRLVEQLDQLPEQIHIGVMILEVSDVDGLQLGVDFAAVDAPSDVGDSVVQGGFSLGDASGLLTAVQDGLFPRGISVGVAHGTSRNDAGDLQVGFPGLLNIDAVRSDHRFKILSETSLQSQNNREATISVVNEIPILKSEISGGSGTARDVIQNIERMDVGVKLTITPHYIPDGMIRMALHPSIEAVVDSGPEGKPFTPTIAKREVQTTVTVLDGRTIVIAGLTRRDERQNERRVPILGSIPLLRWLFTRTERVQERSDLLILVTPTVVSATETQSAYRRQWEEKTGLRPDATE